MANTKSTDTALWPTLAGQINAEHEACCRAAFSALEHARTAGELLIQAKEEAGHGAWLPWLTKNCPSISERSAQGYMRVARRWPELESKAQRIADLPLRGALALLAEPTAEAETPVQEDNPWRRWIAWRDRLEQIRDQKLYRESYDSFEAFLMAFWNIPADKADRVATVSAKLDDLGVRWRADVLAQIWDLAPGIDLTPVGITEGSIPKDLPLANYKKILSLFVVLDPGVKDAKRPR